MDDLKGKLQRKIDKLKETDRLLKSLLDAAENFAAESEEIKHRRRDHQLQPLTAAADNFVAEFTRVKLDLGYKMR